MLGAGETGYALAQILLKEKHDVIIIEENEKDLGQTVEVLNKIEAAKPEMENIIYQIIQ